MGRRLLILMICVAAAASCGHRGGEKEDSPETVMAAFNRAVESGDFAKAWTMVDSLGMKDYMESYQQAWDTLSQQDSTALSIAGTLLGGVVPDIRHIEKDGQQRRISYSLEAGGKTKQRKAVMKKEEGGWKIVSITDAN